MACFTVGACNQLITDGVNGMLAASSEEWYAKLDQLLTDRARCEEIALAGLALVHRDYTRERCFDSLLRALLADSGAWDASLSQPSSGD